MISTHILDTTQGKPAAGVEVKLQLQDGETWKEIQTGSTNADGRFSFDCEKNAGVYRLIFETESYFKREKSDFFFMSVPVIFKITDLSRKYHVPLLLNPFGYSTYRGT